MSLRRALRAAAFGAAALALAACAGRPDLADYAEAGPPFAPEVFFDGELTAWGLFQDRFGEVRRSFVVDIDGDWDGETLTLDERFTYEDGSTERRVWSLRKTGPTTWAGSAEGVIGQATGETRGNAFTWAYEIDLPTPDGVLNVSIEDWIWGMDGRVAINRAYVDKFGVEIGQLSIFFLRDAALEG
ncbi:MAG: DUF3833 domain-containing protein [Rubrimonas sp.]|uniref:DUF3833 domain-containing protein n=1 Tax=Rubrimonas sp. TaxID=2036015 RepID=UPI002FDE97FF